MTLASRSRVAGSPAGMTRAALAVLTLAALAGCASTSIDENFADVKTSMHERLGAEVRWLTTDEARQQAQADVDAILAGPLDSEDAVRIALANSPALQAMLYEGAATASATAQSARLPNPVFAFERLARNQGGASELEITRTLSFSVVDLLLLPSRLRRADYQQQSTRLVLASGVVRAATQAREAWVHAVAAQQSVHYSEQVKAAADASAELARRMQAVGNFSKLQRAREQSFSAEAVVQLARSRQAARSTREALVRALGLSDAQAVALRLPDRLPDLPAAPKDEASVAQLAMEQRIDVRMARSQLEFTAQEQGLTRITSFVNGLEFGASRVSETGLAPQTGFNVEVPLPIFDFGDASRSQAGATYMAALHRAAQLAVDASSQVREDSGSYRTAYDVARHYRDEIVPLRKAIAEENVLRYNGMLIGVFELLADAREQIASVMQAIDAQRDFWLADANLQATLIGRPSDARPVSTGGRSSAAGSAKAATH